MTSSTAAAATANVVPDAAEYYANAAGDLSASRKRLAAGSANVGTASDAVTTNVGSARVALLAFVSVVFIASNEDQCLFPDCRPKCTGRCYIWLRLWRARRTVSTRNCRNRGSAMFGWGRGERTEKEWNSRKLWKPWSSTARSQESSDSEGAVLEKALTSLKKNKRKNKCKFSNHVQNITGQCNYFHQIH